MRLIRPIMPIFDRAHVKMYSTEEFRKLFISGGLSYVRTHALNPHQKVHIGEKT